MTALLLALSLSNSFTKVGAIVAFAAIVGIALLAMLFFAQARELKRLREWSEEEPQRMAESSSVSPPRWPCGFSGPRHRSLAQWRSKQGVPRHPRRRWRRLSPRRQCRRPDPKRCPRQSVHR